MDLYGQFLGALRGRRRTGQDPTPADLAQSAATVLDADAAAVTLVQPVVRLPIGATDDRARLAEQVQATVGSTPSLLAATSSAPVGVVEAELAELWPLFHHALTQRTDVRSVASFALREASGHVFAVLDLYSADPTWRPAGPLVPLQDSLMDLVAKILGVCIARRTSETWWPGDGSARRRQVWVAVGMLCEAAQVGEDDAMAMLRAYAFAHDLLLDEVAAELMAGRLVPDRIVQRA